MVALGLALEKLERPKAKERQAHGQTAPGKNAPANLAEASKGEVREKVAAHIGMKRSTYEKAKAVVVAASAPGGQASGKLPQASERTRDRVAPAVGIESRAYCSHLYARGGKREGKRCDGGCGSRCLP